MAPSETDRENACSLLGTCILPVLEESWGGFKGEVGSGTLPRGRGWATGLLRKVNM